MCVCVCASVSAFVCVQGRDLKKGFHRDYQPSSCFDGSKAAAQGGRVRPEESMNLIVQLVLLSFSRLWFYFKRPCTARAFTRILNNDKATAVRWAVFLHC